MAQDEPTGLAEVQLREELRDEELAKIEERDSVLNSRDRRYLALFVTFSFVAGIILPAVGAVVGLTVRAFCWAAGW